MAIFYPFYGLALRHAFYKVLFVLTCGFLSIANVYAEESIVGQTLTYTVSFDQTKALATVTIDLPNNQGLKAVSFNLAGRRLQNVQGPKKAVKTKNNKMVWRPPLGVSSTLSYDVIIPELRKNGHFSALATSDWLIMRAEDLVPPFRARFHKGYKVTGLFSFKLPEGWSSVNTGYKRSGDHQFLLSQNEQVPSPKGWIIAGRGLNTRHDKLDDTSISISGPSGQGTKSTQMLVFVGLIWSHIRELVGELPDKLLIVTGPDPMWRGGLSAPNGLFVHTSRPLISENGTSTLLHELMHVLSGIRGDKQGDWIAEGLAEYYSVELVYRAGGYSATRREAIIENLAQWGSGVKCLNVSSSSGPVTARAVVLLAQLNNEVRVASGGKYQLDDLLRLNLNNKKISLIQLKEQFLKLVGAPSKVLEQRILHCEHPEGSS